MESGTKRKGQFEDILDRQPPSSLADLRAERQTLIRKIQTIRKRPLVVYAINGSLSQPRIPAYIHREDLVPLSEILDGIEGKAIDVLLETPGGLAEVTVEVVNLLRQKFDDVSFVVPHTAMSAGTILVMSGDEIVMDHRSSLGPIDPQFTAADGRMQAAQAMLAGIDTIKDDVVKNNGTLNPAYVPILRNVDPGKLQAALNASKLSRDLVSEWLANYKFRKWTEHSSGKPVTPEDRRERASEIASKLCDHQTWLSHARPIKMEDLRGLRLKITDMSETPDLQDAVWRLWVHLHHIMSSTNIYKVYESNSVQIVKLALPQPVLPTASEGAKVGSGTVDVRCNKCGTPHKLQFNFGAQQPAKPGTTPFPKTCQLKCDGCGNVLNLQGLKLQLEAQLKQPVLL